MPRNNNHSKLSPQVRRQRLKKIRLLAMDVDGVLTAGDILLLNSGEEIKIWNVKDRIAFFALKHYGDRFPVAWITGRQSQQVADRSKEVGVVALYQRCEDKGAALRAVLKKLHLAPAQCLFVGDDWVDLPAFREAGLAVCPADAHATVQSVCHWVTRAPGGRGVIREVVDAVFEAQGLTTEVLQRYTFPGR